MYIISISRKRLYCCSNLGPIQLLCLNVEQCSCHDLRSGWVIFVTSGVSVPVPSQDVLPRAISSDNQFLCSNEAFFLPIYDMTTINSCVTGMKPSPLDFICVHLKLFQLHTPHLSTHSKARSANAHKMMERARHQHSSLNEYSFVIFWYFVFVCWCIQCFCLPLASFEMYI